MSSKKRSDLGCKPSERFYPPSQIHQPLYRITILANNLDVVGNTLQGTGNALIADGEEAFTLDQIGSAVQAIGNSTVIIGLISTFSRDTKDRLIINGNFIQALGGGVSAADITENAPAKD